MSFCRWSTDDFQCDLYVYEHVDGFFVIHVAGNKVIYTEPLPEPIDLTVETATAWVERQHVVGEMLERCQRVPLDLPHDGETFTLDTANEAADKVEELRALGYRVPREVVDELRAEAVAAKIKEGP